MANVVELSDVAQNEIEKSAWWYEGEAVGWVSVLWTMFSKHSIQYRKILSHIQRKEVKNAYLSCGNFLL
jgi:hypothetical protein